VEILPRFFTSRCQIAANLQIADFTPVMELLFQFLFALANTTAVAIGLYVASRIAVLQGIGSVYSLYTCFGFAAFVVVVYTRVIYPFFDPLRKYPIVDVCIHMYSGDLTCCD
jgi:hypothetical protein